MKLGYSLRTEMQCRLCQGTMTDHEPGCIQLACEKAAAALMWLPCPVCRKHKVDINHADFYECRNCNTQFSASLIAGGADPDTLEREIILDEVNDRVITVVVLPKKGRGYFPKDVQMEVLDATRQECLRLAGK